MSANVNQIVSRQAGIDARRVLKDLGVNSLLADPVSNPKVAKNMKQGVMTAPLHLAPAKLSGFNVCPMATQGCIKACLHTAGNPLYMAGKRRARIARTRAYFKARNAFMIALAAEIEALQAKADAAGMICGVRLNATSDIPWERVPVPSLRCYTGDVPGPRPRDHYAYDNLMQAFPRVRFYDYTKRPNRKNLPRNYKLTFSLAENNDAHASEAIQNGMNVAVVFDVKRNHPLPRYWGFYRVIDGDVHDYRPADPRGVIVGLRAKGKAIGDVSGFVRHARTI